MPPRLSQAEVNRTIESKMYALENAINLYTRIATGEFGIYNHLKYKFHEPDLAKVRDIRDSLTAIKNELDPR